MNVDIDAQGGIAKAPPDKVTHGRNTLIAATLGFFVITLDAVVVNVALPTIGRELHTSVAGLQWVVDSYTLMFAALLLSSGALSDRIGARQSFGLGLVIFVLASVACGLAPNAHWLTGARFLQGVGAAALMPSSMALIRQAYPESVSRGRAVALWATGGAVAATSGPMVGGLFTLFDWRWIFMVNVPVGLVTLAFLSRTPASPKRPASIDWLGQCTAVVAMSALTFGAIEAGDHALSEVPVWGALLLAIVALGAFVWSQRNGAHPMLPSAVIASRNAKICMLVGFTFMTGYFGLPFVMSLYLQQQRGLSSFDTGVTFLPMMVVGLILTPFSARLMERPGPRASIICGLILMTAGLGSLSLVAESASIAVLSVLMVLVGLAGPLVAPPVTALLLASVPSALSGTASGAFHTCRQIGGALAVAVFGVFLARSSTFMDGLHRSLIVACAVALLTASACIWLRSGSSVDQ